MFHLHHPSVVVGIRSASILAAGLFSGAALYITAVDTPARSKRSSTLGREEFQYFYPLATNLQATLTVIASVSSGLLAYLSHTPLLYVPCMMFAAIPAFTVVSMVPLNNRLMDRKIVMAESVAKRELTRWSRLHCVRTLLSSIGFVILVVCK